MDEFKAVIVKNRRVEKCTAKSMKDAEAIFNKRLKPGEVIISTINKTECPGGGMESS